MRFYLNETSLQGQFEDERDFRPLIEQLLAARARSPVLAGMRTTPALADRPISHERSLRQVVQGWRGSPTAAALLAWVGRNGPFIHEDRLDEAEDLFHCLGVEVTEGGLGEAARRLKSGELAATFSFPGGAQNFTQSPLHVVHGFEDEPFGEYPVENFWDADAAVARALHEQAPATNWQAMVETARQRFPKLLLPNALYEDARLVREPFDAIIRDRFYALLGYLDAYMRGRDEDGNEGREAQEVLQAHFQGERALFSPESATNRRDFQSEMTFPDPEGGTDIFAQFHGKISYRFFRLHFDWPVPAAATRLKVLYIGPKLTKS
ncbi:hypothetical protein [Oryzicola mucosus]|uniref:Uncharacterized protein n=1 Tax=Oryzicola mucosus TaxID=2767425 RepID=A0A8J6PMR8_9HYPH|nr:hypothetical protein [Oryzicola mucosus]MBD0417153.1 hypothetical protein [Oryzicola mucosus]